MAQKITISGYVKDAASKEALIGATVVNANAKTATSTNQYGFFSLSLLVTDTVELIISYAGYVIQAKKITLPEQKYWIKITILISSTN